MSPQDLLKKLEKRSVRRLTRLAAVLALVGLAIMVLSIVWPRPLVVIAAMSVGHVIGAAAVVCYGLAVLLDISRGKAPVDSLRPPPVSEKTHEDT
jgi:hypothetical protein